MKRINRSLLDRCAITAILSGLMTLASSATIQAAPLNLSRVPLYTNEGVEPNFVLTFDDSGSMARGYVPDAFSSNKTLFPGYPHVDGPDAGTDPDPIDTRCWWATANWSFSPEVNKLFYNPAITYSPPIGADGVEFANASFGAAREDGVLNTGTARNLNSDFRINWELGGGSNRPKILLRASGSNVPPNTSNGANCETADTMYRTFPFSNARAFYYAYQPTNAACLAVPAASRRFNNACYTAVDMTTRPATEQTNFANWYSYYRTRSLLARSSLSRVFDSQQKLRVAWQNLNANQLDNSKVINTIAGGSTQRTQLFSFIFNSPVSGNTPNRAATKRVGDYFGGGTNQNSDMNTTNPYYDVASNSELSCRQNFHLLMTDGGWNSTAGVIGNFDTQSFTLPAGGRTYTPNTDHTNIYSKEHPDNDDGLADNAFFYWSRDLRPNLANNVPASYGDLTVGVTGPNTPLAADELPSSRDEIYWNPKNDPATWQHMTQYIVGFGIGGNVPFPSSYDSLRAGTYSGGWPNWGGDGDTNEQVVDDTWHAAINSRGDFFSVNDPQELITALSNVFSSIANKVASNTPVSLSSGLLTSTTLGYQTLFDTSDWSGRVVATNLDSSTAQWDVSCVLTGGPCTSVPSAGTLPGIGPNSRLIATSKGANGIPFRYASLSTAQKALLNRDPLTGSTDTLGSDRLNYIRGERSKEQVSGGPFRNRKSLLGSVVNSSAVIWPRASGYRDDISFPAGSPERAAPYSTYVSGLPEQNTVLFGANDGMLHAVNAGSAADGGGQERWAFVPATVFANLNKLTSTAALEYQSYVDASPAIRDAFINGRWTKVLVGGLRLGGQGVYALDVTNSILSSEGDVAAKVLWEFSDKSPGGSNLGYTYGEPFITRTANGDWVALIPGGYNSEESDGAVGSGNASLFVLRLADGTVLREFDLGPGSRGLSSVNGGDYRVDGAAHDFDVLDVAFAGDLNGDIWRFNFEGTSPGSWAAEKFFDAPANQSVTVLPRIVRSAYEDVGTVRRKYVVTFGTGKYIEGDDRSSTSVQSYYGVYDQGAGSGDYPITQSRLRKQTLTQTGNIRQLTTNQVALAQRGWYFNMIATGERSISTAVVRNTNGSLIFTTLAPLSANPCEPTAQSFLMFVDGTTGGVPGTGSAGIDSNNDGVADTTDAGQLYASFDSNLDGAITSADSPLSVGIQLQGYAAGVTPISNVGGGTGQIILPPDALPWPDNDGNGVRDCEETVPPSCSNDLTIPQTEWRRRSWRELSF